MEIKRYEKGQEEVLWKLFFETVRNINLGDYSKEQVEAWASDDYSKEKWRKRIEGINPYVCIINGDVAGYADLQKDGYIDHFFVSKDYQKRGVARALIEHIMQQGRRIGIKRYYTQASITARPFFERFSFEVVKEQEVELRGVLLRNYLMELIVD